MKTNIEKGQIGERIAENYLENNGYKIVETNFRNKIGEIDIIASKENNLIFVEVESRTSLNYGYPYEAVNYKKQNKIIRTSLLYIQYKNLKHKQLRYDIIEVFLASIPKINHIENAFSL